MFLYHFFPLVCSLRAEQERLVFNSSVSIRSHFRYIQNSQQWFWLLYKYHAFFFLASMWLIHANINRRIAWKSIYKSLLGCFFPPNTFMQFVAAQGTQALFNRHFYHVYSHSLRIWSIQRVFFVINSSFRKMKLFTTWKSCFLHIRINILFIRKRSILFDCECEKIIFLYFTQKTLFPHDFQALLLHIIGIALISASNYKQTKFSPWRWCDCDGFCHPYNGTRSHCTIEWMYKDLWKQQPK